MFYSGKKSSELAYMKKKIDPNQSHDFHPTVLLYWLADKGLGTVKW